MEQEIDALKKELEKANAQIVSQKSILKSRQRQYEFLSAEHARVLAAQKDALAHAEDQIKAANEKMLFWKSQGEYANQLAERTRNDYQIMMTKHDQLLRKIHNQE